MRKKSKDKEFKKGDMSYRTFFGLIRRKKQKNLFLSIFLELIKMLFSLLAYLFLSIVKLLIFLFIKTFYNKNINEDNEIEGFDKKVFSYRCIIITSIMIVLISAFVYYKESLFYSYPILTCILPFMLMSEGINFQEDNKYKDLKLYNSIIRKNIIVTSIVFLISYKEIWFISPFMILIMIIPLIIGNLFKTNDYKNYDRQINNL